MMKINEINDSPQHGLRFFNDQSRNFEFQMADVGKTAWAKEIYRP